MLQAFKNLNQRGDKEGGKEGRARLVIKTGARFIVQALKQVQLPNEQREMARYFHIVRIQFYFL